MQSVAGMCSQSLLIKKHQLGLWFQVASKMQRRLFIQIRDWWSQFPNANIGLNLEQSGLVCIDVDSYKPECEFNSFIQGKVLQRP